MVARYRSDEREEYRERALAAEEAIRDLVGMLREIDGPDNETGDYYAPTDYVGTDRAKGAIRRAMRNRRRPRSARRGARHG